MPRQRSKEKYNKLHSEIISKRHQKKEKKKKRKNFVKKLKKKEKKEKKENKSININLIF